ncbi:helix-turn-helix domain-containing protein [Enterocloster clostridioformis]|uniref:helix-turn-helix domain-containing protein n=1 Tax=Enterocloster clostridioformis TaxID=1531 RepID=UPI000944D85A
MLIHLRFHHLLQGAPQQVFEGFLDILRSLDVILLNRPEAQEQIKALSAQGKNIREISAETGIPKSTVQRLKKNV